MRVCTAGTAHAVVMYVDYDASAPGDGDGGDGVLSGLPSPGGGIHHSTQWVRWLRTEEQRPVGLHSELCAEATVDLLAAKVRAAFRLSSSSSPRHQPEGTQSRRPFVAR